MRYEVLVGNIGFVFRSNNKKMALKAYQDYVAISETGAGRAGHEPVTLFADGEVILDHSPKMLVNCDSCQMLSINGIACHEIGCPNSKKSWDPERGQWIKYYECFECGSEVEEGNQCDCQNFECEDEENEEDEDDEENDEQEQTAGEATLAR